jgi:hypothetical protein
METYGGQETFMAQIYPEIMQMIAAGGVEDTADAVAQKIISLRAEVCDAAVLWLCCGCV